MQFSCLKPNLVSMVQLLSRVVSSRPTLPVLNNILIEAEDKRLKLSATNLDIGINAEIPAKIETEGSFTVPAKLLADFVASVPDEKIDFRLNGNTLHIESGRYKADINGIEAEEFPENPSLKGGETVLLRAQDLAKHLPQVTFAAAADEARPVITGVLMILDGRSMTLVAADGYRLAEKQIELTEDSDKLGQRLIIPARSLDELLRILSDAEPNDVVELAYDDNQVIFTYQSTQLISRLLAGQYPDYKQIIPQSFQTQADIDRAAFHQAMRVGALFAKDSASVVKLSLDGAQGQLALNAVSAQVGENETILEAVVDGPGGETAYNARYVLDFLAVNNSEQLRFKMNDPLGPGLFVPVKDGQEDPTYVYVVMPIRT